MATDTPVRIEMRLPGSRPTFHEVTAAEFLIGSVAGCDLVLPGGDLPPVVGVVARTPDGIRLRKLAPNLKLAVNGKTIHHAPLTDGDVIAIGNAELHVHMPAVAAAQPVAAAMNGAKSSRPWTFHIPLGGSDNGGTATASPPIDTTGAMRQLQQENDRLRQLSRELDARQRALDQEEQSRRQAWAEREAQFEVELDAAKARRRDVEQDHAADTAQRELALATRERELAEQQRLLDQERRELDAAGQQYRDDLVRLERQRNLAEQREAATASRLADLEAREREILQHAPQLDDRARRLEQAEAQLQRDQQDVQRGRAELDLVTLQLNQRASDCQQRETQLRELEVQLTRQRDDLGRQATVLTDQKARHEAAAADLAAKQQQFAAQERVLTEQLGRQAQERADLDARLAETRSAALRLHEVQQRLEADEAELKVRVEKAASEQTALDAAVREHREDLLRLDRSREALDQREKDLKQRAGDLDCRQLELEETARRLEARDAELTRGRQELAGEHERIRQLKADLEAGASLAAEQSASAEGQQAIVLAVRAKLERLRDELRHEARAITEQRSKQDMLERELTERQRLLDARKAEIEAEELARGRELQTIDQRTAMARSAAAEAQTEQVRLQAEQSRLQAEYDALAARSAELDKRAKEQGENAALLRDKAAHLLELQQKIDADRMELQRRELALDEAEQARAELQQQLLRRAEELAARQQAAEELAASLQRRAADINRDRESVDADLAISRRDLDARAIELQGLAEELQIREENYRRLAERMKEAGRVLAAERKARFEARQAWDEEHRTAAEDLVRTRAELERYKSEVLAEAAQVQQALPDLELRGTAALERLSQAREQLRSHVAELHEYARQSQDDLETLRHQVQSETERLRDQQSSLTKARSDHRLAVTAFRQQLIDWQGRVSDMKSTLAHDDTRLTRKASELDEAAKAIEGTAQQLARQAAAMQAQQAEIAQKRDEVEYHLTDMRDWFRRKLKELATSSTVRVSPDAAEDPDILPSGLGEQLAAPDHGPRSADETADVLAITQDLDPGDRKLGELLQALDLVDDATLTALLLEARRQRRSLRQVLLASGKLTVYQMALIEAGNVDGLTIGPLGVIDRLHVTPREAVYRVIDPRPAARTGPLVLRHLSEAEMADAVRPDEFRQRFAALTKLHYPHVAATVEVMEIHGRPAALQEWLTGLPGHEWPSLAAAPGVWYRLACQAVLGLAAAHQHGLTHGALSAKSIVLTSDGLVKLTGIGEPPWLSGTNLEASPADDVLALGRIASEWATLVPKRKLTKTPKPLPTALRQVLDAWLAGRFASAVDVLDALDRAGSAVPAGAETWERLMRYTGANATEGVAWRKSA